MEFEKNPNLLKDFLEEHFDFDGLKKLGFFSKDIKRKDYKAQSDRICTFFGFETVYEWRKDEVQCHLSEVNPDPKGKFVTVLPSIYD